MPNPEQHADNRPLLESILRWIPGFTGYLEQGYRRESDRLQRQWLADRLQRSKQGLADYTLTLTNAGQIDQLPACDQMRSQLDRLISRLRGSVSGYSGFFDFVQVDQAKLEQVYEHDHALIQEVDALGRQLENLTSTPETPGVLMPKLSRMIADIETKVDQREDMLRGLGE